MWTSQGVVCLYTYPYRLCYTLVNGSFIFSMIFDVFREPLVKLFMWIKQRWHNEVKQGPQLSMRTSKSCEEEYSNSKDYVKIWCEVLKSHKPLPYCSEWVFQLKEVCSYTRSQGESSNARCKMKKKKIISVNYCKMHHFMSINWITGPSCTKGG